MNCNHTCNFSHLSTRKLSTHSLPSLAREIQGKRATTITTTIFYLQSTILYQTNSIISKQDFNHIQVMIEEERESRGQRDNKEREREDIFFSKEWESCSGITKMSIMSDPLSRFPLCLSFPQMFLYKSL